MSTADLTTFDPDRGVAYIQETGIEQMPAPAAARGPIAWVRKNLLATWKDVLLTAVIILLAIWILPPLIKYALIDAVWTGKDREACLATAQNPEAGACWAFVRDRFSYFIYGSYPIAERWRVDIFFAMLALGIVWMLKLNAPRRDIGAFYFFVIFPISAFILLSGVKWMSPLFKPVDTSLWGGLLVTVVVATVGIVVSLPFGIVLALGRRSKMPAVKLISVIFIEFVRGVPLITVLFMASVMLPLFVPEQYSPDKLLRALVGIAVFASAYMAEVVRAGLQAMPKGQFEGAMALGLNYPKMMRLIILPQALRITIPNIVNNYIALFKDTTLVYIVGVFDFLKTIEAARIDPTWSTPTTSTTGYLFAAIFYFICCYAMSRYAKNTEARLAKADRR